MMNDSWIVIAALAGFLVTEKASAFSVDEASRLYEERFAETPPSVQRCGEYLFVIVEGKVHQSERGGFEDAASLAQMGMLGRYIGSGTFGYVSPFGAKLTARLPQSYDYELPPCKTVTVFSNKKVERFREVIAIEAAPVEAERNRVISKSPSKRSVDAWSKELKKLVSRIPGDEGRRAVLMELGATIPLIYGKSGGLHCFGVTVDAVAVERLLTSWNSSSDDVDACLEALSILPSFSSAHQRLARLRFEQGDSLAALDAGLKSRVAGKGGENLIDDSLSRISEMSSCLAWKDFGALEKKVYAQKRPCPELDDRLWTACCRSLGRIAFSEVQEKADAARETFLEARTCFREGKDLPRILLLLSRSVSVNPAAADAWALYGDALRTDGRHLEAVVAYHEALVNGGNDESVLLGLCRSYSALGLTRLCAGNAWWALMSSTDERIDRDFEAIIKRCLPDELL